MEQNLAVDPVYSDPLLQKETDIQTEKRMEREILTANVDPMTGKNTGKRSRNNIDKKVEDLRGIQRNKGNCTDSNAIDKKDLLVFITSDSESPSIETQPEKRVKSGLCNILDGAKYLPNISGRIDAKGMVNEADATLSGTGEELKSPIECKQAEDNSFVGHKSQKIDTERHRRFICEVCRVDCNTSKDLDVHLSGKKHAKLTKEISTKAANPACGPHMKERDMSQGDSPNGSSSSGGRKVEIIELEQLTCLPCKVNCNSKRDFEQHVSGKKHAERIKKVKIDDTAVISDAIEKSLKSSNNRVTNEPVEEKSMQVESFTGAASNDCTAANDFSKVAAPLNGLTGDSGRQPVMSSTEGVKKNVLQGSVENQRDFLRSPLLNDLSAFVRASGTTAGNLICDPTQSPTRNKCNQHASDLQNAISGIQSNEVLYDLCGRDCGRSSDDHGIVTMHASCFLKLLKNASSGSKGDSVWQRQVSFEEMNCKLCRVEFGSMADLEKHVAGKKHAAQCKRSQLICEVCNKYCNSTKTFEAHLSGKQHASKLRLMQKRGSC